MRLMLLGSLLLLLFTTTCFAESWTCSPNGGVNDPIRWSLSQSEVTSSVSGDDHPYHIVHNDETMLTATSVNLDNVKFSNNFFVHTFALNTITGE